MIWTWEDRDREDIVYDYWQIRRLSQSRLQGSVRIFYKKYVHSYGSGKAMDVRGGGGVT